MDIEKLKEVVCEVIDKVVEDLAKLSYYIWFNFEFVYEEFKVYDLVIEFLDKYKFLQVDRKFIFFIGFRVVCGDKVKGLYVAFLTEYDVLFEIGYVSGYNFIVEFGVVIAIVFKVCFEVVG